jgi:hypothetical protein
VGGELLSVSATGPELVAEVTRTWLKTPPSAFAFGSAGRHLFRRTLRRRKFHRRPRKQTGAHGVAITDRPATASMLRSEGAEHAVALGFDHIIRDRVAVRTSLRACLNVIERDDSGLSGGRQAASTRECGSSA